MEWVLGLLYTGDFRPHHTEGTKASPRKEIAESVPRRKVPDGDSFSPYTVSPPEARLHRRVIPPYGTVQYGTVPISVVFAITLKCIRREIIGNESSDTEWHKCKR